MPTLIAPMLLAALQLAAAEPIRVVDLTGGSPGLPVAEALADLGGRIELLPGVAGAALPPGSVLLVDGGTDMGALAPGSIEALVAGGGGVLVAGLPDALPKTTALWRALGAAAPADVPAADLFPDDSGDWVWVGTQPGETANHTRWVRRAFEVTKPVRRAMVRCTVDNLYTLYLNGEQIGEHWSWYDHEQWDIAPKLRQGRNVLAFNARNVDGPGGLFAQIGMEYEDGTHELIASDASWRFRTAEEPGWTGVDFDDGAWGPPTDVLPMVQYTRIFDRGIDVGAPLLLHGPHPLLNALAERFGTSHSLRGVTARLGATVLATVGEQPVVLCAEYGQGRAVLIDAVQRPGSIGASDLCDDLLATSILWLGRRGEGLAVAEVTYPPASLRRTADLRLGYALKGIEAAVEGTLEARLTHNGDAKSAGEFPFRPGQELEVEWTDDAIDRATADGEWLLDLTARDTEGNVVFHRTIVSGVASPLSVVSNRRVVARGVTLRVRGDLSGILAEGDTIRAAVVDPWGRELLVPDPVVEDGVYTWTYEVPDLAEGDYRLVATRISGDQAVDSFGAAFTVVPRLDLADFFPTTMRLSEFGELNKSAIEREIDDIIAHGFNTLTFSGHRLGAEPGSPYDYAEDYAQRKGMAVSYSFQGDFCLLPREGLPPVSVFSPEYQEAIRPRIDAAVETCRQVPRLLNVQGYMDEPFQISGDTLDERPAAKEEFRRRYGIDMPTREEARQDPALWLKYIDFWSDCFAAGWRQSYAMVKELDPDFWVELTHDSHNTFGAAGNNYAAPWAVDDVFHWGAPFDSVNYDIYPYLSIDFRTGNFGEHRLPRIAGMHMAFAELRNTAYTYGKKLGFWVESGWDKLLAPGADGRRYPWSPRELTFTAIGAGCDYLNTFWGIPEDPAWWETYRRTMAEVQSIAPLLTRSRVPRARAAFLFPRTQHVLLQEEYWNVMVALEAFRQAYGELDCIHEEQLSQKALEGRDMLVLLDIHLLKRADAQVIRDWVRAGGRLVADEVPSLDESRQPLGIFEPLFGVTGNATVQEGTVRLAQTGARLWGRRGYEAAGARVVLAAGGTPLVLSRREGEGRAVLLNYPVKDCYLDALLRGQRSPSAEAILSMLRDAATEGGRPANVTSSNPNIEAAVRQTPQGTMLLIVINHESKDEATRVTLPRLAPGGVVRDLISGERVETGPRYAMNLQCPWGQTRVLGIFPSDPSGLKLEGLAEAYAAGDTVEYALTIGGEDVRGNYLVDVTVTGPDGRRYEAFSALTCTEDATCRRSFPLPVNAQPGRWTISAMSRWDGSRAEASFEVR